MLITKSFGKSVFSIKLYSSCSYQPPVARVEPVLPGVQRIHVPSILSLEDQRFIDAEIAQWNPAVPIAEASTPPPAYYTDARFLAHEKRTIFAQNWIYAGRTAQLDTPGAFITGDVLGEPYIITRDAEGQLNAFINVCRHHGTTLKEEKSGKCGELVCPYHGWTYSLDGKLIKTTSVKGIKQFQPKAFGLFRLRVAEMGPLLFVHFGSDEKQQDEQWNELMKAHHHLAKTNYDKLHHIRRVEYLVNCNWKIYVDNYIDGAYHVPYLHPGLNAQVDNDQYSFTPNRNWCFQTVPPAKNQQNQLLKERMDGGASYCFLYPTLGINRFGSLMDTNFLYPISVDKTLIIFDWYYIEPETAQNKEKLDALLEYGHHTQTEDEIICERVQKGLESRYWANGRYAPAVEAGVHHFHRWYHANYNGQTMLNHE